MIETKPDGIYQDGINLGSAKDAAWNQGILEMHGIRQQTMDTYTCQRCGHSRTVRRDVRFVKGLVVEYAPAKDPGCFRCAEYSG